MRKMPRKVGETKVRPVKVNIPPHLVAIIDEVVKSGLLGYRSRDEFVTDAVRRRLEELGFIKKQSQG